ncbi:MAG: SMP-30/gluconolactonase/LRE family protein [Opitutaceae bacterium]|nr:SMP-30/gluconolactonase/LRE family protein [Opitutaceae bacterium]
MRPFRLVLLLLALAGAGAAPAAPEPATGGLVVPAGGRIRLLGDSIVRGYGFGNYTDPSPLRTIQGIARLLLADNVPYPVDIDRLPRLWQGFNPDGTPVTIATLGDEVRGSLRSGELRPDDWLVYEDAGEINMIQHPAPWPSARDMYGRNRAALRSLLEAARAAGMQERVLLMTMFDYQPNHAWSEWDAPLDDGVHSGNDSIRDEAAAQGARVVDLNRIMDRAHDHVTAAGWGRMVGPDGIHPNVYGNYVMALSILGTLGAEIGSWKLDRLQRHFLHPAAGGDVERVWGFTRDPSDDERVRLLRELQAIVVGELSGLPTARRLTEGAARFEGDLLANEGPSWDGRGHLYFSAADRISRRDREGRVEVVRRSAGRPNGTLIDPQGRLVVCEGGARRVIRLEADGGVTVLAETCDGMKLNSPNDLAIDPQGRIYFTDPRYGNRDTMEMRDAAGQAIDGVYRIDAPGQVVRVLTREVERPNGILIPPDGRALYVADHNIRPGGSRRLWRFDLRPDGSVDPASRRQIFDWGAERGPDGFKLDTAGRLYVAAGGNRTVPGREISDRYKGGIYILSPEGELLEFVPVAHPVTNCAFGGDDLRTLYITAAGALWSVRTTTPGIITAGGGRPAP